MADICLSYAHEDADRVRRLRDILARYFSVWWDSDITAGDYRAHIEAALTQARCVVPVWSAASRISRHVTDELEIAEAAGVPLLPVRIEPVSPPLGFGRLQLIDLVGWDGREDHEGIEALVARIRKLTAQDGPERQDRIRIGEKEIASPSLVFSVSSHETQIVPTSAVQALSIWNATAILVSAYDVANSPESGQLVRHIEDCLNIGSAVLLDSGNYEAYRKSDTRWTPDRLHRVLENTPHDAAFSFDNTRPPNDWRDAVADVLQSVERDARYTSAPLIPILHVPRRSEGMVDLEVLPRLAAAVAGELRPPMIAFPERELGDGLVERARTMYAVRSALNQLGYYQAIHLLGTGNPLSAAVLALAGADCFDGLEWCRTVADHRTGALYHFQHYDLVSWQTGTSDSRLAREVASNPQMPFAGKVAFHNLDFFDRWMADLRNAIWTGRADRFLTARIPGGDMTMEQLAKDLPEVFS